MHRSSFVKHGRRQLSAHKRWLPIIPEMSLVGFKTRAAETTSEFIDFLSMNPSPRELLNYHVSERGQARLQRLLALNEAGLLSEAEHSELAELEELEHIVIMLKAQIALRSRSLSPRDNALEKCFTHGRSFRNA